MPTKIEKDALSGQDTTGHEWDGVKELNTPLPTWWVYTFYATIVFAVVYCVLYPSWPWLNGHTHGVLGYSSRAELTQSSSTPRPKARGAVRRPHPRRLARRHPQGSRAVQLRPGRRPLGLPDQLHAVPWRRRRRQPRLSQSRRRRLDVGRQHRPDPRRPSSTASATPTTSRARSLMPRFGADGLLTAPQVAAVTDYVLSLSGRAKATPEGAKIWQEQCVACHQADGKGNQELGAPNLTDGIWLYGGDRDSIYRSIFYARNGSMPAWSGRLDEATIKMLAHLRPLAGRRTLGAAGLIDGCQAPGRRCGLAADAQGGAAALRHPHQGLSARRHGPWRRVKWAVLVAAARPLLPRALAALGPRPRRARPGDPDRPRRAARLVLRRRDLAAGDLLRHRPADPGAPSACSSPRRCSAGSGAATPARRPCGPICSCWSSA